MEVKCPGCNRSLELNKSENAYYAHCECGKRFLLGRPGGALPLRLRGVRLANYKITDVIGMEPTGALCTSLHLGLNRAFLLKVFCTELSSEAWLVRRFVDEARLAGRIYSPFLARVSDFQKHEELFYAIDLPEGLNLIKWRKEERSIRQTLRAILKVASALQRLHDEGLLHLSPAPSSIRFISPAQLVLSNHSFLVELSESGSAIFGELGYIAPEVLAGSSYDRRADIYSLGLTLYYALTGRRPIVFSGSVLESQAPELNIAELNPHVPLEVDRLIREMTSPDPEKRPNEMAEVIDVLKSVTRAEGALTTQSPKTPFDVTEEPEEPKEELPPTVVAAPQEGERPPETVPEIRRRFTPSVITALAEGALIILLTVMLLVRSSPPSSTGGTTTSSTTSIILSSTTSTTSVVIDQKEAEELLQKAIEYEKDNPEDFAVIIANYREIALRFPNSISAQKAIRYRANAEKLYQKYLTEKFRALSDEVEKLIQQERFGDALTLCSEEEKIFEPFPFKESHKKLVQRIHRRAGEAYEAIVRKANELASLKSFTSALTLYQPVIEKWGIEEFKNSASKAIFELRRERRVYVTSTIGVLLVSMDDYLKNYRFDRATRTFQRAIEREKEPTLRPYLSSALQRLKLLAQAKKDIIEFLQKNQDKPHLISFTGATVKTRVRDIDEEGFFPELLGKRVSWSELKPRQMYEFCSLASQDAPDSHIKLGVFSLQYSLLKEAFAEFGKALSQDANSIQKIHNFLKFHGTGVCFVPGGNFTLGSDKTREESPEQLVYLDPFLIGKYEVTRWEYSLFIRATVRHSPWETDKPPEGTELLPVTNVSWEDAMEYAKWLGATLPSEFEWEKSARGTQGRRYLWEEEFQPCFANLLFEREKKKLTSLKRVGYGKLLSPYGCYDIIGNCAEWTADWYRAYPGSRHKFDLTGREKVIRGGSFKTFYKDAVITARDHKPPTFKSAEIGFRIVWKF